MRSQSAAYASIAPCCQGALEAPMKSTLAFCLLTSLCFLSDAGCNQDTGSDMETPPTTVNPGTTESPPPMMEPSGPTEFVALRVGDGTATLASDVAAAVFLERRKLDDGALVGNAIAVPVAASGAN